MSADLDLYVNSGSKPTSSTYGCRPYIGGTTAETCIFVSPTAGTWWIGINNFATGTISYRVTATYTTGGGGFYPLSPCRAIDTRGPSGPDGAPALVGWTTREFTLPGKCGVPADAKAVSTNITVTQVARVGNLRVYPANFTMPLASAISLVPGKTRANNYMVMLATDATGKFIVFNESLGTTEFIVDVNGYFK